ncbi:hypothetical protein MTO96_004286 [Rhipicephalus appendiculatus]
MSAAKSCVVFYVGVCPVRSTTLLSFASSRQHRLPHSSVTPGHFAERRGVEALNGGHVSPDVLLIYRLAIEDFPNQEQKKTEQQKPPPEKKNNPQRSPLARPQKELNQGGVKPAVNTSNSEEGPRDLSSGNVSRGAGHTTARRGSQACRWRQGRSRKKEPLLPEAAVAAGNRDFLGVCRRRSRARANPS